MKKLSIVGGILFALGMLVATGIDVNPVQAIYALLLLGGGAVCFSLADASTERTEKTEGTESPFKIGLSIPQKHKKTAFLRSILITAIVIAIAY